MFFFEKKGVCVNEYFSFVIVIGVNCLYEIIISAKKVLANIWKFYIIKNVHFKKRGLPL